jgi:hypothetical protein
MKAPAETSELLEEQLRPGLELERKNQPGDTRDVASALKGLIAAANPADVGDDIVVGESDDVALGNREAGVPCTRQASATFLHVAYPRIVGEPLLEHAPGGCRAGTVLNDDHLKRGVVAGEDGLQTPLECRRIAAGGDDHADRSRPSLGAMIGAARGRALPARARRGKAVSCNRVLGLAIGSPAKQEGELIARHSTLLVGCDGGGAKRITAQARNRHQRPIRLSPRRGWQP